LKFSLLTFVHFCEFIILFLIADDGNRMLYAYGEGTGTASINFCCNGISGNSGTGQENNNQQSNNTS